MPMAVMSLKPTREGPQVTSVGETVGKGAVEFL